MQDGISPALQGLSFLSFLSPPELLRDLRDQVLHSSLHLCGPRVLWQTQPCAESLSFGFTARLGPRLQPLKFVSSCQPSSKLGDVHAASLPVITRPSRPKTALPARNTTFGAIGMKASARVSRKARRLTRVKSLAKHVMEESHEHIPSILHSQRALSNLAIESFNRFGSSPCRIKPASPVLRRDVLRLNPRH